MRPEIQRAIELVREKRPEALDQALGLLQDTVLKYSLKICRQHEDAEDTAQEVLIRTARFLPDFENPMALSVWLYKVARTQCMMKRRKSKFAPEHELSLDDAPNAEIPSNGNEGLRSPEEFFLRIEGAELVLSAIRQLPDQQRQVITLHDLEELSTAEVAQTLGISEGAVRVRLHRARTALRELLQPMGVDMPILL